MVQPFQPVDYSIATPGVDLAGNLGAGLGVGAAIGQGLADVQRTQALQQQARQDMAQKALQQQALVDFSKNPSQRGAADLLIRFPGLKEQVGGFMGSLDEIEKKERIAQATEATGFLISGDTEGASSALLRSAEGYKNAGRQQDADTLTRLAETVKTNPAAARAQMQIMLEAVDPEVGKRLNAMEESRSKVKKEGEEARKTGAEADIKAAEVPFVAGREQAAIDLANQQTQRLKDQTANEAKRLGLDERELAEKVAARKASDLRSDVELSEKQQGLMDEAATSAEAGLIVADELDGIARAYEEQAKSYKEAVLNTGFTGTLSEFINSTMGRSGTMTKTRLDYKRLVDQDIKRKSKGLGTMSENDYKAAFATYPDPVGDPAGAAAFARKEEQRTRREAAAANTRAQWLARNGGLGPAKKAIVVNGTVVQPGETLQDAVKAAAKAAPTEATKSKRTDRGQTQAPAFARDYE